MRYVAFDLETAKVIPTHVRDWHSQRLLGISCAATLDETGDLRIWYGKLPDGTPAPQMTQQEARTLLSFLEDQQFNEDRPVDFTLPRTVKRLDDMRVEQALQWPEPDTSWMSNPPDRADFLAWTQENGEHLQ